jgi:hypothetical protein
MKSTIRTAMLLCMCISCTVYAESVFLKDGSIIEGNILKETKTTTEIITSDKTSKTVPRSEILRILYHNNYKNRCYLTRTDGSVVAVYIVDEDSGSYVYRTELSSRKEMRILKNEVVSVSKRKTEKRTKTDTDKEFVKFLEYNGHDYYYSKKVLTWTAARDMCRKYGGYLAVLTDEEENQTVSNALKKIEPESNYWIGLSRSMEAFDWTWVNGEPYDFKYWSMGEPNNYQGKETCVAIWSVNPKPSQPFKWNDCFEAVPTLFIMEREK